MRTIRILAIIFYIFTVTQGYSQTVVGTGNAKFSLIVENSDNELEEYFSKDFESDFGRAVKVATEAASPFAVKFPVKIRVIVDVSDDAFNGERSEDRIDIQVGNRGMRIEKIKSIFWHEYGHEIFHLHLDKTAAGKESVFLNQIFLKSRESMNEVLRVYGKEVVEKADGWYGHNLNLLLESYDELLADVFRVMVKQDCDDNDLRNFRHLDLKNTKSTHSLLNPVRDYLWRSELESNLNNQAKLLSVWKNLLAATLAEIDSRYLKFFGSSNRHLSWQAIKESINEDLIARFKAEKAK
ncbi:MAG: hypothetical protein A4S09_01585 [Proteobacteria bacterium SG_bin7]|nr:MAG: hypothetical protein A4S09_01585 [Proteobacteria bacterium SG_bin7]